MKQISVRSFFLICASVLFFAGPQAQATAPLCQRIFSRPPLPLDQQPLLGREQAQVLLQQASKFGEYSLLTVQLKDSREGSNSNSPQVRSQIKVVVDSKVQWLTTALEKFANKPAAQVDQKTVRAFLEFLSKKNLSEILPQRLLMYQGDTRQVSRDGGVYYMEELMQSPPHKDLALALLGQSLMESYGKKESRVIRIVRPGSEKPFYGLLILNGNPEVVIPGLCSNLACGEGSRITAVPLQVDATPASLADKNNKQFFVIDHTGRQLKVQVSGRSATERKVKEQQEQIQQAQPEELVPVEFYHMIAYLAGGTTMFRIGDSMYHFGSQGWEHQPGTEGIKGFLTSNPYSKRMFDLFRGFGLPPFNLGVTLMIPKSKVMKVTEILQAELQLPEDQRQKFNFVHNNCVQVALRIFEQAGVSLGTDKGFQGFSSSLTFRDWILHSPYPTAQIAVYPMPGVDLTEAQYRSFFPGFVNRAYSVKKDRELVSFPGPARDRYRDSVVLAAVALSEAEAGPDSQKNLLLRLQKTQWVVDEAQLQDFLRQAQAQGLLTLSGGDNTPTLTELGKSRLVERSRDYDLDLALPK